MEPRCAKKPGSLSHAGLRWILLKIELTALYICTSQLNAGTRLDAEPTRVRPKLAALAPREMQLCIDSRRLTF